MATEKVVEVKPFEAGISSESDVFHAVMERGIAVCMYYPEKRIGGATIVTGSAGVRTKGSIEELLQKLKAAVGIGAGMPVVKIVVARLIGVPVNRVKEIITEIGLHLTGELVEEAKIEFYFYSDSGRLRVALDKTEEQKRAARVAEAVGPPEEPTVFRKKKVLIVDDSKIICQLLSKILGSDAGLEIIGTAEKPSEALKMIEQFSPDVITLDIHMPEMDGVKFLEQYLPKYPIPTVMITSLSLEGGNQVLHAMEIGAVDYIQKPSFEEIERVAPMIVEKVKIAAAAKIGSRTSRGTVKRLTWSGRINNHTLVAIGASTGGTEALKHFFVKMPAVIPPIVVVQHIPPVFSKAFAHRLAELCPFKVKEAEDGDHCLPNQVLIAPGGMQMAVEPDKEGGYHVRIFDGEPVNRHKPSVDVLFNSVARHVGKRAISLIMTGMGRDGAQGMLAMKQAGARTMAQDEGTCVVFGMPKEAIKLGCVDAVHPLDEMSDHLIEWLQSSISSS